MSRFDFVRPELDTQAQAEKRADNQASVTMPAHWQDCYVMQLPNGKFTYVVSNVYPQGLLTRLNARLVSSRHIGQMWEPSQEGS